MNNAAEYRELKNEIYYLKRYLEIEKCKNKKLEQRLEDVTKEKNELYFKQPHLLHLQQLKQRHLNSMNNATEYRKLNVIGTGKRTNFFINHEITKDEKSRVVILHGSRTMMPDDIFEKFKKWIKEDKRYND